MEDKNAAPTTSNESVLKQITALHTMPFKEIKERYQTMFPDNAPAANKDFLIRRIAYKLQEEAFGALSTAAQEKLETLKTALDPLKKLGQKPPRGASRKEPRRLPIPGTIITKTYKGTLIQVKVLEKGLEYNGQPYRSLSRIAQEITGVHQSGFVFFGQ